MVPISVERTWKGQAGHRMHVFAALVDDTDRNQGNVLYDTSWNLWMIDFTRAFRVRHEIRKPKKLRRCDRDLLAKMRQLDEDTLRETIHPFLTSSEVRGVRERRDRILEHFESLIADQGESAVLY